MKGKLTIEHVNALEDIVESDAYAWGLAVAREAMQLIKATLCSSSNRHDCIGVLWQCAECESIVCCVEGDEHDELCDDCWHSEHKAEYAMESHQ